MNEPPPNAAFSLIEVMIAILVLGVALVALTRGITTALESSKESEQATTAALFAAGQIETLRAEGDLENGETDGDCGAGLKAYRWKQTITDADIDGLHNVDVVVERAQNNQEIYELKTLLFEPSSDTSDAGSKKFPSQKKRSNAQ